MFQPLRGSLITSTTGATVEPARLAVVLNAGVVSALVAGSRSRVADANSVMRGASHGRSANRGGVRVDSLPVLLERSGHRGAHAGSVLSVSDL
jgi:hypothetical protein